MNDRKVTVNEADLRAVLAPSLYDVGQVLRAKQNIAAALDTLGPDPFPPGQWVRVPGHHDEPFDWECAAHSEGQNCCADRDDIWMRVDA